MNKYAPECPFCERPIPRPVEMKTEFGSVSGGSCECGAVYVCDPTGHNIGEAYMEALALAKGNWQINSMGEDVDYEASDMDYDMKSHQRVYVKGRSSPSGKLIFVKLKEKGTGLTTEKIVTTPVSPIYKGNRKDRLKGLLELRAYHEIADLAMQDKGIIRGLISMAYDKEDIITWRAIEAMGVISGALAGERMSILRDTVRRLLWSMGEESGGIGWSAAEMLGEIVYGDPDAFDDIIPILWSFREEAMFRAGVVRAMGRIAMIRPDLIEFVKQDLPGMMRDSDPAVRGHAVWVTGILGDDIEQVRGLLDDSSAVLFYKDGNLIKKTVGEIAADALHKAAK